jgi:Uma2 family endonuclease
MNRMASQPRRHLSPEEYLDIERRAHTKSEYYAGEMFAMSGTSYAHSLIVGNVATSLHNQFTGHPCEVHTQDLRVKVSETGLYTYPDIIALCGKAELEDRHHDTLLNPMLIIEVLSDSTEAYDRGAKFQHYGKLESVQEYVLISQDRMLVERFRRQDENEWLLRISMHADDVVDLHSVNAQLRVADIYARVQFDEDDERPRPPENS